MNNPYYGSGGGNFPPNSQQQQQYLQQQQQMQLLHQQQFQQHPPHQHLLNQQQQHIHRQQPPPLRDESLFKLQRLDEINNGITKVSSSLIAFFDELTKDKQANMKLKPTKTALEEFLRNLKKVETDLLTEINNLTLASTGHQHEGSIYGARKNYDLAKMQLQLIGSQLNVLQEALDSPLKPEEDEKDDGEDDDDDDDDADDADKKAINGN
jgi:hypothetical protein